MEAKKVLLCLICCYHLHALNISAEDQNKSKSPQGDFESKVSLLLKKLMSSKYLTSDTVKERLGRLGDEEPEEITKTTADLEEETEVSTKAPITPVNNEALLTRVTGQTQGEIAETSTKYPLWDPLSAEGKPRTRPPYVISFTPYTTPTPLPNRPDWKKEDWFNYFKENHPNFWFQKQMQQKIKEKLNNPADSGGEGTADSQFDYENWKSWSPEEWVKWSNSKEYKENYLNVLNPYRARDEGYVPFKTYEDLDGPVLNFKDSQPVYLSELEYVKAIEAQKLADSKNNEVPLIEEEEVGIPQEEASFSQDAEVGIIPPRTYFPPPTLSPTKDPFYLLTRRENLKQKPSLGGISNEYIVKKTPEKAGRVDDSNEVENSFLYKTAPQHVFDISLQERQLGSENSRPAVQAFNPEDLLLKTTGINNEDGGAPALDQGFSIPNSNFIKNLVQQSGKPILAPLAPEISNDDNSSPVTRQRPAVLTVGGVNTYNYSPQPVGSTSTSASKSPNGSSSSSAAAAGAGASTSTSTSTGINDSPELFVETPNNNVFYPCLDASCDPVSSNDEFIDDYKDADDLLLEQLFGEDSSTTSTSTTTTESPLVPVFNCTTMEECLQVENEEEQDKVYLDEPFYDYEEYRDATVIQRPSDRIVTRPVFSPEGSLLFEGSSSSSEEKLDKLINSLGSLINLLNATRDQGVATYFPGFPAFVVTPRPGQKRPDNSPGHIAVVTSPFLQNNLVKLKSGKEDYVTQNTNARPLVVNVVRKKAEKTDLDVFPFFLKQRSDESLSRKKRWSPLTFFKKRPRQIADDTFVPSDKVTFKPQSVQTEDLLTRITNVPQNRNQMNERVIVPSSLSQMEMGNSGSNSGSGTGSNTGSSSGGTTLDNIQINGLVPFWLNQVYLDAILQQTRPNPNQGSASTSTSCGPRGCSAAAAAGSSTSTSNSANGGVVSRPLVLRPQVAPVFQGVALASNATGVVTTVSGGNNNNNNNNNFGRGLDFRKKRAPVEATSLQSLLAHHRIDTNMLKTKMSIGQPAPAITTPILTPYPKTDRYYHKPATGLRSESQKPLPESFYTNSDIFPQKQVEQRQGAVASAAQKVNNARVDYADDAQQQQPSAEKKSVTLQDTAIIALKLSQSILNLYKTVSPYLNNGGA